VNGSRPRRRDAPDPLESYREVRALVVGGGGFIGRHVVAALEGAGAQVRSTNRAAIDLRDDEAVSTLIAACRPSITFNLAGYGVDPAELDPREAELLNDRFVGVLAQAVFEHRDERWPGLHLVHAGSALEYGNSGGDLRESTPPDPSTFYGRTKLAGTRRLAELCERLGLRAATARLFMIYGPGEHEGRLVPSLLRTAITRQPLPLTAGAQDRDFTWVGDAAEGLPRLGVARGLRPGEVLNVATGRLTSVRAFVEAAARALSIPTDLLRFGALPTRAEEMRHGPVAVGRAKELLDWLPPTTVEEGLRKLASGR
jgi:nucleoside-diphosphate-sugar epimerase